MKKIIVTAFVLMLLIPLWAQKRVIVLLPCDKGGEILTRSEKEAVRAGMIDAIITIPGYDAFMSSSVDELLEERAFSRTCDLSDYVALKISSLVPADYILASSAKKEDNTLFVTSYAMNTRTVEITNEYYGQSSLKKSGLVTDCSKLCQSIIEPMLNPVPTQPTTKNDIQSQSQQISSADDLQKQIDQLTALQKALKEEKANVISATVGQMVTFSDGSRGVCFYTEGGKHGLVVSMDQNNLSWDLNKSRKMQDISLIPNQEDLRTFEIGKGLRYTNAILSQLSQAMTPAAAWCRIHGVEWYLPSAEEMNYLLRVANLGKGEKGPISKSLELNGGIGLNEDWYWTSSENDHDEAINVSNKGKISSEDKDEKLPVRAIRAF